MATGSHHAVEMRAGWLKVRVHDYYRYGLGPSDLRDSVHGEAIPAGMVVVR